MINYYKWSMITFKESDKLFQNARNTAIALQKADVKMPWEKRIKWFKSYILYLKTNDIMHVLPNKKARNFARRYGHVQIEKRTQN